jgi:4-hydroxy-tetrahydrodipicolinate reductase
VSTGDEAQVRVGVLGARGKVGSEVCRAVEAAPDTELVASVDAGDDIEDLVRARAEVVVDFTHPDVVMDNLRFCIEHGIHAVVGTTGLDDADLDAWRHEFAGPDGPNCVVAPNFALSAVLMMRFAEVAAPFFDTAEIIELHHDRKVDAPSGTALRTAERMAAASDRWAEDPTTREVLPGARGGAGPGGIRVHAVRMRGMVAHQEVVLGALGQTLTIRQDSYDRESFMPGVILACKHVAEHPGLTVGLDPLLGL